MSARGGIAFWEDLAALDPTVAKTHVLVVERARAAALAPTSADSAEAAGRRDGDVFLVRRAALRALVAKVAGVAPASVAVSRDARGAPVLAAPGGLHVSISARGDWAALAVSDRPVGVDLEIIGPALEPAWNVLAKSERGALAALPAQDRHRAFLELWTAKEAYLKARGSGLAREPSEIAATFGADSFTIRDGGREVRLIASLRIGLAEKLVACIVL